MKYYKFVGLLAATFLRASCSSIRVLSDYEPETDFTEFKSFNLLEHKGGFPTGMNSLNTSMLGKEIVTKMTELGYTQSDNPELQVSFYVHKKTIEGSDVTEYYEDYNYVRKLEAFDYVQGTLIVDIIDANKKEILWHGILQRPVDEIRKTADKRITQNIEKLFGLFEEEMLLK